MKIIFKEDKISANGTLYRKDMPHEFPETTGSAHYWLCRGGQEYIEKKVDKVEEVKEELPVEEVKEESPVEEVKEEEIKKPVIKKRKINGFNKKVKKSSK